MKILQVVTLVTPEGAYGGPVRVAVNQTRALLDAGHDVTLAAAASGFDGSLPTAFDGVPVKLFHALRAVPGAGFAGIYAPSLHPWLLCESARADVMHVHMGRDLITLPCAAIARTRGVPYVLQTHGMIMPSKHRMSPLMDGLWTRPALQKAARVFYLTDEERDGLREVGGNNVPLQRLVNGVPLPDQPVIAGQDLEVLFLARLHSRKRPLFFVDMAARLHARFPDVRFSMVGPDEGEGDAVQSAIVRLGLSDVMTWQGALEPSQVTQRVSQCTVYVLPSVDEPFPMTVLEAMALGKPVVVTDTCGLADYVSESGAGAVVGPSIESLTEAVASLLSNSEFRANAGRNAKHLAQNEFSMTPVASLLSSVYEEVSENHA